MWNIIASRPVIRANKIVVRFRHGGLKNINRSARGVSPWIVAFSISFVLFRWTIFQAAGAREQIRISRNTSCDRTIFVSFPPRAFSPCFGPRPFWQRLPDEIKPEKCLRAIYVPRCSTTFLVQFKFELPLYTPSPSLSLLLSDRFHSRRAWYVFC